MTDQKDSKGDIFTCGEEFLDVYGERFKALGQGPWILHVEKNPKTPTNVLMHIQTAAPRGYEKPDYMFISSKDFTQSSVENGVLQQLAVSLNISLHKELVEPFEFFGEDAPINIIPLQYGESFTNMIKERFLDIAE